MRWSGLASAVIVCLGRSRIGAMARWAAAAATVDRVVRGGHLWRLRGFTKNDPGPCAGTYAGAAERAGYLADLGITDLAARSLAIFVAKLSP